MITALEPKVIWQHFDAVNAIPRASENEAQIIDYMISFGKSLDLETVVDTAGNVIIKKPGTKGKENNRTVVLQGHLDMVHQKEATSNFDFATQGILMYVDDDWVKAEETTLGADNGIGVATIMSVLTSKDIAHPPIEALFTIDEEKGMTGAMALTKDQLTGEILLNLDSEEDDTLTIGCAGGIDVEIRANYELKLLDAKEYELFEIQLNGLTGGHSGVDIHLNRANAILVLVECLKELTLKLDGRLHSMNVGTLTNVVPRNGSMVIAIREDKLTALPKELKSIKTKLHKKYGDTDPELSITLEQSENTTGVLDVQTQKKVIDAISNMPNGVFSWTQGVEGLVQTSNNIAIAKIGEGQVFFACHSRSSVDSERGVLVKRIRDTFSFATLDEVGPYPGWEPIPDSPLLKIAQKCYEEVNKTSPKVESIHAGLECGIIAGVYPTMQMISFGPNILGAHSPDERVQISSVQKFWKFLNKLLQTIE